MGAGQWRLRAATIPEAVVIALPGGADHSHAPVARLQPSYLRMSAFAPTLHYWGRPRGLEVWVVRYRYRGWNGEEMSPVDDGLAALEEVRRTHGSLPVVLLGHSMGGRLGLRLAGDPSVRGVVALAPWLPVGEPTGQLAGRRAIIAHGSDDRVTSPAESIRYAERARAEHGRDAVDVVVVQGEGHSLLRRPGTWDRIVRNSVQGILEGVR